MRAASIPLTVRYPSEGADVGAVNASFAFGATAAGATVTVPGVFDSGPIPPNGGRWSWVASVAGTFTYHCLIHPDMNGTVSVTVPSPTSY